MRVCWRQAFRFPGAAAASSEMGVGVEGLVCDICAGRLQRALEAEGSAGRVDLAGARVMGESDVEVVERAVRRSMVLGPVRRGLAWRPRRGRAA